MNRKCGREMSRGRNYHLDLDRADVALDLAREEVTTALRDDITQTMVYPVHVLSCRHQALKYSDHDIPSMGMDSILWSRHSPAP